MDLDEGPRRTSDALKAVEVEDLDRLSVTELEERIARLDAEIIRTRRKMEAHRNHRQAADALFRKS